jgi:hypothetical protein
MQSEVEVNRQGKLVNGQKIYLFVQFLQRLGFILIWLLFIFIIESVTRDKNGEMPNFYSLIITMLKIVGIMSLCGYTWMYASDIFLTKPIQAKGVLLKYRKRPNRSEQYWLAVGPHRILTTQIIWLSLQTQTSYELYYGRWTKQLLSYEQLSSE